MTDNGIELGQVHLETLLSHQSVPESEIADYLDLYAADGVRRSRRRRSP